MYIVTCALMVEDGPCSREDKMARWTFYRGWNDYKSGFGQLTAEFWLGNDKIHRLTAARPSSYE